MIQSVKVLIPYVQGLAFGKGQDYRTEGKNVLVTGDMGLGKSSLMHMIAKSYARNQEFEETGRAYLPSWYSRYLQNSMTKDRTLRKTRSEKNMQSWLIPEINIKSWRIGHEDLLIRAVHNPEFLPPTLVSSEELRRVLLDSDFGNLTDAERRSTADEFLALVGDFADSVGVPKERLYGIAAMMEREPKTDKWYAKDCPFFRFFYAQLIGDIDGSLIANISEPGESNHLETHTVKTPNIDLPRYSHEVEDQEKPEFVSGKEWKRVYGSSGQRKQMFLDEALSRGADHLILDEPMHGLDEKAQDALEERLLENEGTQFFVVTHDRLLRKRLRDSNSWVEWDLNK